MRKWKTIIGLLIVVVICCWTGSADAATLKCMGGKCGGTGAWDYLYELYLEPLEEVTSIRIGSCSVDGNDYSNFLNPANWSDPVFSGTEPAYPAAHDSFTPHGSVSPGPDHTSATALLWAQGFGDELRGETTGAYFYFGFDNIRDPQDVGFLVDHEYLVLDEDWDQPVGAGLGPVHGPVPEPATMSLLALGGAAVLRRRRKRAS